ncbi:MAG: hypothetical protein DWQ04_02230 [Chloroflexi bacterium]|nr:MAG: hypothetical protein DWQ04_02230 [Chloroflexota bacterium]
MSDKEFKKLADDLRKGLDEVNKIGPLFQETLQRFDSELPDRLERYIPGGILHDFYHGVESILFRIARQMDLHVPEGASSHRDLLNQMANPFLPNRRQPVISQETANLLDEYRSFRHLFRAIYGFDLNWKRLEPLLIGAKPALDSFNDDIEKFINLLKMLDNIVDSDF